MSGCGKSPSNGRRSHDNAESSYSEVEFLKDLREVLDQFVQQGEDSLLPRMSKTALTTRQQRSLRILQEHFRRSRKGGRPGGGRNGSPRPEPRPASSPQSSPDRDNAPRSHPPAGDTADEENDAERIQKSPWKSLLRDDDLELEECIRAHLELHGTDPVKFLSDRAIIDERKAPTETGMQSSLELELRDYQPKVRDFVRQFKHTVQVDERMTVTNAQWCYRMLAWCYLIHHIRSDIKGSRLGPRARQDIQQFLGGDLPPDDIFDGDPMVKIAEWYSNGWKLRALVQRAGLGVICYLVPNLSPYFVRRRMTCSGTPFEHAVGVLSAKGIIESAKTDGTGELGRKACEHLLGRYGVDFPGQESA